MQILAGALLLLAIVGASLGLVLLLGCTRFWPRGAAGSALGTVAVLAGLVGAILLLGRVFESASATVDLFLFEGGRGERILLVRSEWKSAKGRVVRRFRALDPGTGRVTGELDASGFGAPVRDSSLAAFGQYLLSQDLDGNPVFVEPSTLAVVPFDPDVRARLAAEAPGGAEVRRVARYGDGIRLTFPDGRTHLVAGVGPSSALVASGSSRRKEARWVSPIGVALVQPRLSVVHATGLYAVAHDELDRPETLYFGRLPAPPGWRFRPADLGIRAGKVRDILVTEKLVISSWAGLPPGSSSWHDTFDNTFDFVMAQDLATGSVVWVTRF